MEISRITPRLYVSGWPSEGASSTLAGLGVRLVISMTRKVPLPELAGEAVQWVHIPSIDSPLTPISLAGLRRGVEAAIPVLADGRAVLCHCTWGRHRSVAMAGAILVAQGLSAEQAMDLIASRRHVADPRAFWIAPRIRKFERRWHAGWSTEVSVPDEALEEVVPNALQPLGSV